MQEKASNDNESTKLYWIMKTSNNKTPDKDQKTWKVFDNENLEVNNAFFSNYKSKKCNFKKVFENLQVQSLIFTVFVFVTNREPSIF